MHYKTIGEFFKKKREIVRFVSKETQRKKKKAEEENRIQECTKYINMQGGHKLLIGAKQDKDCLQNFYHILSRENTAEISPHSSLTELYVNPLSTNQFGIKTPPISLINETSLTPSQNKRQVYLSNVTNLKELKKSLSYSRAKFNKQKIKLDREIGQYYIPFQDKLHEDEHCIKGIFI